MKGRVVFLGDRVKDQNGAAAVFEEFASSPAGMEASKFSDAYGLIPGNSIMQADADQAYTQADMAGKAETWIDVPKHLYAASWDPQQRYVMRMDKALYGHPAAGSYWEAHCHKRVLQCGFVPIGECS